MKRGIKSGTLLGLCLFWCLAGPAEALTRKLASGELQLISRLLYADKAVESASLYLLPSQLVSQEDLARRRLVDERKAERLYSLIKDHLGVDGVSKQDIDTISKFVEFFNAKPPAAVGRDQHQFLYIHKEDAYLRFPVQVYPSGRIYIHLQEVDQRRCVGGYKKFSRSVEYHSERPYAHLTFAVRSQHDASLAMHEIEILSALDENPAIVEMDDAGVYWEQPYRGKRRHPRLSYEARLYERDLHHYLPGDDTLPIHASLSLAEQMTSAVLSLHRAGFLHRDLKPENMLVDRYADGTFKLVLADFGLAEPDGEACGAELRGTPGFIAPEHCLAASEKGRAFTGKRAGRRGDAYALGMIFMALSGEGHGDLAQALAELNEKVFDSEPHSEVEASYDRLVSIYHDQAEHAKERAGGEVERQFYELALQMIHPEPGKRPSLRVMVAKLRGLARGDLDD